MSGRVAGKRCFVTAAAAGIGRASALALAAEGARVVASDIDAAGLLELQEQVPEIDTLLLDVTDARSIERTEGLSEVDVLFNCAGYVHDGTILDCDASIWRHSFEINVTSMFHLCRAVLPGMIERGGGSIVNMSSVAGSITGVPRRFAYGASKAAVIGLTKAIAADFVSDGVRCNAICPGTVRTPSLEARVRAIGSDEHLAWSTFTSRQPMGRLGKPEEVAALVVYLASDESAFTTGATYVIDGGWTM